MDKDSEIMKEQRKMRKLFARMPENKKKLCTGLMQNAAFMAVTLRELQREVIDHGAVIECKSGNGFDTVRDNPAQKAYTTMIARYSGIISQLLALLPEESEEDPLAEFRDG